MVNFFSIIRAETPITLGGPCPPPQTNYWNPLQWYIGLRKKINWASKIVMIPPSQKKEKKKKIKPKSMVGFYFLSFEIFIMYSQSTPHPTVGFLSRPPPKIKHSPFIKERCYVYNIFTTNYRWLVVIDSNLNPTLRFLFYPNNNN